MQVSTSLSWLEKGILHLRLSPGTGWKDGVVVMTEVRQDTVAIPMVGDCGILIQGQSCGEGSELSTLLTGFPTNLQISKALFLFSRGIRVAIWREPQLFLGWVVSLSSQHRGPTVTLTWKTDEKNEWMLGCVAGWGWLGQGYQPQLWEDGDHLGKASWSLGQWSSDQGPQLQPAQAMLDFPGKLCPEHLVFLWMAQVLCGEGRSTSDAPLPPSCS